MRKRQHKKLVHEGQYVAEVEIELIDTDEGWSPYLSLDDLRDALRRGVCTKPVNSLVFLPCPSLT